MTVQAIARGHVALHIFAASVQKIRVLWPLNLKSALGTESVNVVDRVQDKHQGPSRVYGHDRRGRGVFRHEHLVFILNYLANATHA